MLKIGISTTARISTNKNQNQKIGRGLELRLKFKINKSGILRVDCYLIQKNSKTDILEINK